MQEVTRPGVSWETTDSVIGKWVKFRDECNFLRLGVLTCVSILNVNKLLTIDSYFHNKGVFFSDAGYEQWYIDVVKNKPYLNLDLIPKKMRKNWITNNDKMDHYILLGKCDDGYDAKPKFMPRFLYKKECLKQCFFYLSTIEQNAVKHFSDVNPEIYDYIKKFSSDF